MASRAELLKQNAKKSKFKFKYKKPNKQTKNKKSVKKDDEMDKLIKKINTLKNLDEYTIEKITKIDGLADFIAKYFKENKFVLNTNQLRDIHASTKKIGQLNRNWEEIKLYYNLFLLNLELKNEKNVIPKKFYELLKSLTTIVNKTSDEKSKKENLEKIILLIDSIVGYHKFYDTIKSNEKIENEYVRKINNDYLLNLDEDDKYVCDIKNLSKSLIKGDNTITIYQLRKIFNEFKFMERRLNDWNSIEDQFNEFYPKIAYMAGRELIPYEFYKLITNCMNIINQGKETEKIIKFKNFIIYIESLISYVTYENRKYNL